MDNINPNHYKNECSLECIEAMELIFGETAVLDFCICNAWKYIWRYENKNGKEDLKKANWYLKYACSHYNDHIFSSLYSMIERMRSYIQEHIPDKGDEEA